MDINDVSDVIEALRRGVYDAKKAFNPEYPTLTKVVRIREAELLIDGFDWFKKRVSELEAQVKFVNAARDVLAETKQEGRT